MRKIPLSQHGKNRGRYFAIVDDGKFEELSKFKWMLHSEGYAYRMYFRGRKAVGVLMHRALLGLPEGRTPQVDHVNMNKLDNRIENLRTCNASQNNGHILKRMYRNGKRATSKYKGVYRQKNRGSWMVEIGGTYRGTFCDELDAAHAADRYSLERYGEYAVLNFPT
jgi:hypothetical protein